MKKRASSLRKINEIDKPSSKLFNERKKMFKLTKLEMKD